MPLLLLGGALVALSLGVLPLPLAPQLALALVLALLQGGWARRQRWSLSQLLPWLLSAGRRWRLLFLPLLALAVGLRCWKQSRDALLLVRQVPRQWLVLRHQGRAALVSLNADPSSCARAAQLAQGLGVARFDWLLALDPLPQEPHPCWSALAHTTVDRLLPGQQLQSPGLAVRRLSPDSRGLSLRAGRRRWWVLPDRQAWWSWLRHGRGGGAVWLGFVPSPQERKVLHGRPAWWPTAGSTSGWHQS